MSRLILVRHGEAAVAWGSHADPGLSELGRSQAAAVAYGLSKLPALPIVVSPLRRARETAAPLARAWGVEPVVDPAVGEVPTPAGVAEADRMAWLRSVLATPFEAWDAELQAWRSSALSTLCSFDEDTVVFTHFVVITVAASVAGYAPDHCSQTVVSVADGRLSLEALGAQRATVVR